ncbi:threonine synthase [Actinomarinicola tropica]|uniref:Threonine synthase n=1 Tax=Actinomarinicola tropica TaxID=2789776 RepID=A0A5Q2RNK3_9ACTN|nr:threonine synthase [Actinomarinicola tropica]
MRYVSTRGTAPPLGFSDVLLTGLAADGGLYVPESWPRLAVREGATSYVDVAVDVMFPFVEGSIERDDFASMVDDAYAGFDHPDVAPLVQLDDDTWLLELFHGPTLAFKDVALQLVGRLFDHELARRGERVTIVGATSGDTGSAAIEALRDREAIDVVILHPKGRVSDVQRKLMTTVDAPNIRNVAIDGTFDDCQDLVKAMFADVPFRERQRLSAVNSINFARVMAQTVYYVTSQRRLGGPVSFAVPTGNFGNVFSGYGAMRMGVPIRRFVIGSNRNDILTRFLATGTMSISEVHATLSPAMDIQVSSNLERLLFELVGHDGAQIAELMARFRGEGTVTFPSELLDAVSESFSGFRVDDDETTAEIRRTYDETGLVIDPHTAVGVAASRAAGREQGIPMVVLGTAHPAKFPDAVEAAMGVRPELPPHLADLDVRPERVDELPNDLAAVEAYVAELTRA